MDYHEFIFALEKLSMNVIPVDSELRARLNGLNEHMVFTDENGQAVGFFVPAGEYRRLVLHSLEIPLSDQEIARRRQEKGGSSLQDIWSRMGAK
jgi:hypothetical protein